MFTYCSSLMLCYEYAHVLYILVIICMSGLDVIVELDVEILLRPCRLYHWCRLTPEGHHGDGLV
jgi:hypothetical protein